MSFMLLHWRVFIEPSLPLSFSVLGPQDLSSTMKLLAAVLSFVALAFGQSVLIRAPSEGTTVSPNQTFVVEVDKPVSAH